jgi:hypothetical protein
MIDWLSLFLNTLWLLGLAVLLATLNSAYYSSQSHHTSLRRTLGQPPYQLATSLGLLLFSAGLAATSTALLERLLWLLLTLAWAVQLVLLNHKWHKEHQEEQETK